MIEYIQFFPTLRCNKSCDFCFNKILKSVDFPEDKVHDFINILKENKIYKLDILGGEPFLYNSLSKLTELALEREIEVIISTNGSLIYEIENFIKNFQDEKLKIGISINDEYGETKEIKELIRKYKLWIKTVVRKNILISEEMFQFAKSIEIPYYLIYMDAVTSEDLQFSIPFYEFMMKVRRLSSLYSNIHPVFCKGFVGGSRKYRCPAGTEKITIMPDGSVYPCYLLASSEEFCIGNVFEKELEMLINSEKLDFFRKFKGNVCRNDKCKIYSECHGGCPAHSFIHKGYLSATEPRCDKDDKI